MTLTVQNLRSANSGVDPEALLPGQICFNLADKLIYIGDGSSSRKKPDGSQTDSRPGLGWFSTSVNPAEFLLNPAEYSPAPLNGQVITYDGNIGKPVWSSSTLLTVLASNVVYSPEGTGLPPNNDNVQVALSTAVELAFEAKGVADAALPLAGGQMAGYIIFDEAQPIDAGLY